MIIAPEKRLLSPRDAGELLGRSVGALAALRHRGGGPQYLVHGRVIRYRLADIESWLASGERDRT